MPCTLQSDWEKVDWTSVAQFNVFFLAQKNVCRAHSQATVVKLPLPSGSRCGQTPSGTWRYEKQALEARNYTLACIRNASTHPKTPGRHFPANFEFGGKLPPYLTTSLTILMRNFSGPPQARAAQANPYTPDFWP